MFEVPLEENCRDVSHLTDRQKIASLLRTLELGT